VKGSDWNYGTNLDYLRELRDCWQHQYDWRKQETALNQFHHFKVEIKGVGIHFIHERGKTANSFPIILTHGYPDSFYRFAKIIPMLVDPEAFGGSASDAFDVVVPDLPGYGFSDKPTEGGTSTEVPKSQSTAQFPRTTL
jgi:pimeloyl-ACP methyl ester carboxylesterase